MVTLENGAGLVVLYQLNCIYLFKTLFTLISQQHCQAVNLQIQHVPVFQQAFEKKQGENFSVITLYSYAVYNIKTVALMLLKMYLYICSFDDCIFCNGYCMIIMLCFHMQMSIHRDCF